MARMPAAKWLGEHSPRRAMGEVQVVCVHTLVGFAPAHAAHFSTHANGDIDQSRDTRYQSAANLEGNPRVIAIENEDHGPAFGSWSGSNVPALTDAQVDACARILAWAHKVHGVPLQLCPDSRPGSRGLAYHRQGIDGNFGGFRFPGRVAGGEHWSTSFGKVCPGDRRIAQLPDILERAKRLVNQEDEVTPQDIKDIAEAVWKYPIPNTGDPNFPAQKVLRQAGRSLEAVRYHGNKTREAVKASAGITDAQLDAVLDALAATDQEPDPGEA